MEFFTGYLGNTKLSNIVHAVNSHIDVKICDSYSCMVCCGLYNMVRVDIFRVTLMVLIAQAKAKDTQMSILWICRPFYLMTD